MSPTEPLFVFKNNAA